MTFANTIAQFQRLITVATIVGAATLVAAPASAVNIVISYQYDTLNFFGVGNPNGAAAGAQAKAALDAAASFYSTILTDNFSTIQKPADLVSSASNGVAFWNWSANFSHPATGNLETLQNPTISANEYRIYAGGRPLSGATLGIGGPGGMGWESKNNGGTFSSSEISQINQTTNNFKAAVERRGEPSGFARWGGSITFDSNVNANWHYNHATGPTVGKNDFYSVALHELGHALGLGASSQWKTLASTAFFTGSAATSLMGANPPLGPVDSSDGTRGHWAEGTMSKIYGSNIAQEALLDPTITSGTRKRLTALDAAAMTDIGWSVAAPPTPAYLPADFNDDGLVNAADLTIWKGAFGVNVNGDANGDNVTNGADFLVWQQQFGQTPSVAVAYPVAQAVPEPSAAVFCTIATMLLAAARRYAASSGRILAAKPTH